MISREIQTRRIGTREGLAIQSRVWKFSMEDDDFDPNAIPDLVPLAADKPADSVSAAFTAGADETKTPGAARKEPTRRPPVPLTILTGWLGSGKTSLLHWLLGELGHQGEL